MASPLKTEQMPKDLMEGVRVMRCSASTMNNNLDGMEQKIDGLKQLSSSREKQK